MSDSNRKPSNVAVEQIIGNMTSSMHNTDGQYIQLGFTPPQTPSEPHNWNNQNQIPKASYLPHYNMNGIHNLDPAYPLNQQIPAFSPRSVPFNHLPHSNSFGSDLYDQHVNEAMNVPKRNYAIYQNQNVHNKPCVHDINGMYPPDYRLFVSQDVQMNHNVNPMADNHYINNQENLILINSSVINSPPSTPKPTQFIENLVGNWVPNTTGTYSPFGNMQPYNQNVGNIFEVPSDVDPLGSTLASPIFEATKPHIQDNFEYRNEEIHNFQFSRDTKKPRMVAEVKPMRPSYSDVLTKPVPPSGNNKTGKFDFKDVKQKKENGKKLSKNEKSQKINNTPNRTSAQSEIKTEKTLPNMKSSEKFGKDTKTNQLHRKWASLDNMNEKFADTGAESDLSDGKKSKKSEDVTVNNKQTMKNNQRKPGKNCNDFEETDSGNGKSDILNISRSSNRKGNKLSTKQRNSEVFGNEKPPGKRGQRIRKRENHVPFGVMGQKIKQYVNGWWKLFLRACLWLMHLVSDICSLSIHLSRDMFCNFWKWLVVQWAIFLDTSAAILSRIRFITWIWEKIKKKKDKEDNGRSFLHAGLSNNINMPTTGEEAMKRLLACKGKDPYSILGVTPTCTDDDIKKYYKRQAFLVHPDKNQQPGAEEAFKILVHAFDMIGEPERRAAYDRGVAESAQVEQAWSELTELLAQLQQKVEAAANTIRCSACGSRHKRIKVDRPSYAARNCATCKIHHAAREGDIWAEARCFGFLWHYYACMEGGVYDITEWAGCQRDSLKHLRPDSHHVQYRIALGKQNGQSRRHSASPKNERPPDLENLLNSLYGQQDGTQATTRRKTKKSNK